MEDAYVRLAAQSYTYYLKSGRALPLPGNLPEEMRNRRAGAFVTLHKGGMLRGCIGTISPIRPSLAEEIIMNAVSAAFSDPRFPPLREEELPEIVCSVDVLEPPEAIESAAQLDVREFGVIVTSGRRRGLLLPNLEGVDTVEEQVDIARRKAGIGAGETFSLERFRVVRHQ